MKLTTVRIECDACHIVRQGKPGQGLGGLRLALRRVGWVNSPTNDTDTCPACSVGASSRVAPALEVLS